MPCFFPRPVFEQVNKLGEVFYKIWKPQRNLQIVREFKGRCGQCVGCHSKDVRNKAIRCYHESLLHEQNSFITLTVKEEALNEVFPGGSLRYEPFQKFLRKFRKKVSQTIKFFMCAEYGEKFQRPHYHSLFFGWFPSREDRTLYKETPVGRLYTSKLLESCWAYGYSSVGSFDFSSALYVAGYVHKKINGKLKDFWYRGKQPEFSHSSLKPTVPGRPGGIGAGFYEKYTSDLYRKDKVTLPGGTEYPLPRYYDKLHSFYHPTHFHRTQLIREEPNPVRDLLNDPARLAARHAIVKKRLSMKSRKFEKGDDL